MRLAVWNMCNKADQPVAADQVRAFFENGYDAVALQEVPYQHKTNPTPLSAALSKEMGLDHTFIHTRGLPPKSSRRLLGYGTAILSTSSLGSATHATLRTDRWAYMTTGKGNQRAAIAFSHISNPDVRIVVAHLSYSLIGGLGATGLTDERVKLSAFLNTESSKGKILFAGDTNCKPGTQLDDVLAGAGVIPVPPTGLASDYPTYRSRHIGLGGIQEPLDRVYADPALNPTVFLGEYGPSDHRPLDIEI